MLPLEDIKILALEQYGAGPYGSSLLANLGADIIKIEDPTANGDVGRYVHPYQSGDSSLFFETFNGSKRSVVLNLLNPGGERLFHGLVGQSDAVYCNLRGDVVGKLGLDFASLSVHNPKIVSCSLTGYGREGEMSSSPAYDYVLQGRAGWMCLTGEPDSPPSKSGLSLVDFSSGMAAALAVISGIHAARRDGRGMDCDLSLHDVAIGLLTYVGTWALTKGFNPSRSRHSAHPSLVPFQLFEASDGWLVIGVAKEVFWKRLLRGMDLEELDSMEQYGDFRSRYEHREELVEILESRFRQKSVAEWLEILTSLSVPCGPVNDVQSALMDPIVSDRGMIEVFDHARFGAVKRPRSPIRVGPETLMPDRAPALGEHTNEVLMELLGLSHDEIAHYRAHGALG